MLHTDLANGRWGTLSLMEQLGNIGSEIGRGVRSKGKDEIKFQNAVARALELFDLTLADPRWRGRKTEIARAREVFCDAVSGGTIYHSTLQDIDRYFLPFAVAARREK